MSIKALWGHVALILCVFFACVPLPLWEIRDAIIAATAVILTIGIVFLSSALVRRSDRLQVERSEMAADAAKWRWQEKTKDDVF